MKSESVTDDEIEYFLNKLNIPKDEFYLKRRTITESIIKKSLFYYDYMLGKSFDKIVKTVGDSLYKAGSFFMGE